jgi:hypothetical protein
MANPFDAGVMPEPDPRDHPLYGLWTWEGRPAATAPPDDRHTVLITALIDKADAEPRQSW